MFARLPLVVAALLPAGPGFAQTPPAPSPTDLLTGQPNVPPPAAVIPAAPAADFEPAVWQVDLLVGGPLAVRVSRQLGDSRVWAEGGAGLYLIWPTAFAGVRFDGRVFHGRRHEVLVRPGVDVAWVYAWDLRHSDRSAGVVIGDIDFMWRRTWADGGAMELGLKLGVAAPLTPGARGVAPVAALLGGFSF